MLKVLILAAILTVAATCNATSVPVKNADGTFTVSVYGPATALGGAAVTVLQNTYTTTLAAEQGKLASLQARLASIQATIANQQALVTQMSGM